jgi:hypothetical protein
MTSSTIDQDPALRRPAAAGLWLLPAYGLLLALSTVTQQPDVDEDFAGYARYVTTDQFLVSHLVASIGGAALAVLGVGSAAVFLVRGRARRGALTGTVLTVVAAVYLSAAFGSAAFVQPGVGRAYLRGLPGAEALNADTAYGDALTATIGAAVLVFVLAAITVGTAVARTAPALRWAGIGYAVTLPLFALSGLAGIGAGTQPAAGVLFAVATAVLARRLPAVTAGPGSPTVTRSTPARAG